MFFQLSTTGDEVKEKILDIVPSEDGDGFTYQIHRTFINGNEHSADIVKGVKTRLGTIMLALRQENVWLDDDKYALTGEFRFSNQFINPDSLTVIVGKDEWGYFYWRAETKIANLSFFTEIQSYHQESQDALFGAMSAFSCQPADLVEIQFYQGSSA